MGQEHTGETVLETGKIVTRVPVDWWQPLGERERDVNAGE